jgi:hypothetical protein
MTAAAPVADVGTMFPTEYLGKDEQLLLSRKPKLTAYLFPPAALFVIIGIVLTVVGYVALFAVIGNATSLSGVVGAIILYYLLPFIGWILILVGTWRWRVLIGSGFGAIFLLLQVIAYPIIGFYWFAAQTVNSSFTLADLLAEALGLEIGLYILIGLVLPIPIAYLAWKKTFYGVTNKRTLKVHGILSRSSRDAGHDKMQDVTMDQPLFGRMFHWGDLTFATAASAGGGGSGWRRERDGLGIYWYGVDHPIETRTQVHEIVENAKQVLKVQEFQQMAQVFQQTGQAMGGYPGMAPGGMPPGGMGAAPPAAGAAPAGGVRYCSACGTPNSVTSKFCAKCGAAMPA